MFFGLLCLDRSKTIKADEAVAENEVTFSPLVGFLAEPFLPNRYFVEPLICLQKVTVAGLLVFLAPSYAQMLYGIVFALLICEVSSEILDLSSMGFVKCPVSELQGRVSIFEILQLSFCLFVFGQGYGKRLAEGGEDMCYWRW